MRQQTPARGRRPAAPAAPPLPGARPARPYGLEPPEGMLTKEQAAGRLGISAKTINIWIARDLLDVRYLGQRRVVISADSVDFWLTPHAQRPKVRDLPWNRNLARKTA